MSYDDRCFVCRQKGHFGHHCPNVQYHSCNEFGHFAQDCPNKIPPLGTPCHQNLNQTTITTFVKSTFNRALSRKEIGNTTLWICVISSSSKGIPNMTFISQIIAAHTSLSDLNRQLCMFNHKKTSAYQLLVKLQDQLLTSHFVLNDFLGEFSNIDSIYKSYKPTTIQSTVQLLKTESEFENLSLPENLQS